LGRSHQRTNNKFSEFTKAKTSDRRFPKNFDPGVAFSRQKSKLLNLVAARPKQSEQPFWATEVRRANQHKAGLPAVEIILDLRNPVPISDVKDSPF
jgi:hypothetical protein